MSKTEVKSPKWDLGNDARGKDKSIVPLKALPVKLTGFDQVTGFGPRSLLGAGERAEILNDEVTVGEVSHRKLANHNGVAKDFIIFQQGPEKRVCAPEMLDPNVGINKNSHLELKFLVESAGRDGCTSLGAIWDGIIRH